MKKVLLTGLLLVPFFSLANIFSDGSISTVLEERTVETLINCGAYGKVHLQGENHTSAAMIMACAPLAEAIWMSQDQFTQCNSSPGISWVTTDGIPHAEITHKLLNGTSVCYDGVVTATRFISAGPESVADMSVCPPTGAPSNTYFVPDTNLCAIPEEIALFDSCNINDSPNVQVTSPTACYSKSDGSICSVAAVDVGGGTEVYQGSEGNCYADAKPDITNNDPLGEPPVGGGCSDMGGLLACPEDPENVCGESGSSYGGGSVNNCQSGCGFVNDAFLCYDIDTDSDGLPDYNDPDIDGDGIANGDDLDADGDGKDDPINGGDSGTGTGDGTGGNLDLGPVVSEIKKTNTKLDDILKQFKPEPKPDDLDFTEMTESHKQAIKEFANKTPAELGYIVSFDKNQISGYRNFENAINENVSKCTTFDFGFPRLPYTMATIDMCKVSEKVEPILYWIFAMITIIFCLNQFSATIQGL